MIAILAMSGNVRSVQRAFGRLDVLTEPTTDPETVHAASRVVLPGQGAFGDCMAALSGSLRESLLDGLAAGKPYLGICVGMQVLFEASEEAPGAAGLGVLPGTVRRLPGGVPLPHMGWNRVRFGGGGSGNTEAHFYFAHSYAAVPTSASDVWATCEHGAPFCAAVRRGPVWGVQFHPEKSHEAGAALLREWLAEGEHA